MWGFTITLADGTEVPGVIFPDGGVYVHEPIADSYGRMSDLLDAYSVKHFAVIGPVVPLEEYKKRLEDDYERAINDLTAAIREVKRRYRESKKLLAEYDKYDPETGILTIQAIRAEAVL